MLPETVPLAAGLPSKPPGRNSVLGRGIVAIPRRPPVTWPRSPAQRDKSLAMVFLFLACVSLVFERRDGGLKALNFGILADLRSSKLAGASGASMSRHVAGLMWSAVAIVGRPAASALRKEIATPRAGTAVISLEVGMTSLIQGLVAMAFMVLTGSFSFSSLPMIFWICLATQMQCCSSFLNAIIKTAETHAYKVGEMSLCAPFLAFDPATRAVISYLVLPVVTWVALGGGAPLHLALSLRKASAVACIAAGMLALSLTEKAGALGGPGALGDARRRVGINSWFFRPHFRCCLVPSQVSSSLCLFAYCRLVMAAMCFSTRVTKGRSTEPEAATGLWEPRTLMLLLFVCVVDAAYMLSMYQVAWTNIPVLVSAVKRGGGIVVSAIFGAIFFGEKLEGRKQLLCVVAIGDARLSERKRTCELLYPT
eukprot:Skav207913  [mRNA]  locus=scaffold190:274453:283223:- [translate_table: standard]